MAWEVSGYESCQLTFHVFPPVLAGVRRLGLLSLAAVLSVSASGVAVLAVVVAAVFAALAAFAALATLAAASVAVSAAPSFSGTALVLGSASAASTAAFRRDGNVDRDPLVLLICKTRKN